MKSDNEFKSMSDLVTVLWGTLTACNHLTLSIELSITAVLYLTTVVLHLIKEQF